MGVVFTAPSLHADTPNIVEKEGTVKVLVTPSLCRPQFIFVSKLVVHEFKTREPGAASSPPFNNMRLPIGEFGQR